jgi:hypothetical protein
MIYLAHASDGFLGHHGAHTVMLVVPVVAMAVIAGWSDFRGRSSKSKPVSRVSASPPYLIPAALSLVAAVVHAAVCPDHFHEAAMYGLFFAVATAGQATWSFFVVRRPRRWLLGIGVAGNAALLVLWAVTRTVGVPIGPGAGEVEAIGVADVLAGAAELGVIVVVCWTLLQNRRATRSSELTRTGAWLQA